MTDTKERGGGVGNTGGFVQLRQLFAKFHRFDSQLDDEILDGALGLRSAEIERRTDPIRLCESFGTNLLNYDPTPYVLIRRAIRVIAPTRGDVFYDLGAGYGRVLFYGALTTAATFRGIEIIPARVREAERLRVHWQLPRLEFRQGDLCESEFGDGNLFFLFNPLFRENLMIVGNSLRRIAEKRTIRIASLSQSSNYFETLSWLTEDSMPKHSESAVDHIYGLRLFVSS